MAVIRYEFPVGPGSVQELVLSAEESPKTDRWVPAAPSMPLSLQKLHLHPNSTWARDSLCALQLALGDLAATGGTALADSRQVWIDSVAPS